MLLPGPNASNYISNIYMNPTSVNLVWAKTICIKLYQIFKHQDSNEIYRAVVILTPLVHCRTMPACLLAISMDLNM
jgi:hypothetical protein